jgi:hypothetical protein
MWNVKSVVRSRDAFAVPLRVFPLFPNYSEKNKTGKVYQLVNFLVKCPRLSRIEAIFFVIVHLLSMYFMPSYGYESKAIILLDFRSTGDTCCLQWWGWNERIEFLVGKVYQLVNFLLLNCRWTIENSRPCRFVSKCDPINWSECSPLAGRVLLSLYGFSLWSSLCFPTILKRTKRESFLGQMFWAQITVTIPIFPIILTDSRFILNRFTLIYTVLFIVLCSVLILSWLWNRSDTWKCILLKSILNCLVWGATFLLSLPLLIVPSVIIVVKWANEVGIWSAVELPMDYRILLKSVLNCLVWGTSGLFVWLGQSVMSLSWNITAAGATI